MKIIRWETVGQIQNDSFELCKTRTINTVFCDFYHKIRCFSNYLKNQIATQGQSHSMGDFWLCRYVVVAGILAFEI